MSRVVVVFEHYQALKRVMNILPHKQLGQDFKVFTVYEGFSAPPELEAHQGEVYGGIHLAPHTQQVSTKSIEVVLMKEGLTCGENRFIAGLVRRGGAIVIIEARPSEANWTGLLRDEGVLHVALVHESQVFPNGSARETGSITEGDPSTRL